MEGLPSTALGPDGYRDSRPSLNSVKKASKMEAFFKSRWRDSLQLRSGQTSRPSIKKAPSFLKELRADGGTRTHDLLITNQLL